MPAILLFPKEPLPLRAEALKESMSQALGLSCFPCKEGGDRLDEFEAAEDGVQSGKVFVELPELESDEGSPEVNFEMVPRLDRDESIQAMVDEILEQESGLRQEIEENGYDIILTFDDTPAGVEAASALAYVLASETGSGVLIPAFSEEDDTVWFQDAEDFADAVFGEDDEDGDEDDDDDDDDLEDEEGEEENEEEGGDDKPRRK